MSSIALQRTVRAFEHAPWMTLALFAALAVFAAPAGAACEILDSDGGAAPAQSDPLHTLLSDADPCPDDVFELRALLLERGAELQAAMVANQGFNNPAHGNFSIFESVLGPLSSASEPLGPGEFFFGHFTGGRGDVLVADQAPQGLMIELIVRDPDKEQFNFYELIGNGQRGEWFYRGDTEDVLHDNERLHRQLDPSDPRFGSRLRCSGCHLAGGPIMKELEPPYNDWWTAERGLPFGDWLLDDELRSILGSLVDAGDFAAQVEAGMRYLQRSEPLQHSLGEGSLQVRLRPLFCTVEVNLESDGAQFWSGATDVVVPSAFFADPLLAARPLVVGRKEYESALSLFNPEFPGDGHDADHAWLTPVKGRGDHLAIETLLRRSVVDAEFVADVLAVDPARPVFSAERCSLLALVPEDGDGDWRRRFRENLRTAAAGASDEHVRTGAATLLDHLSDSAKTARSHRIAAGDYLTRCDRALENGERRVAFVKYLLQKRQEVAASEISANRRGQIFESDGFTGFKRLFPDVSGAPRPWTFAPDVTDCEIVEAG